MISEEWFPVRIWYMDAPELCSEAKSIFEAARIDQYENPVYPNGYTTYFSNENIPELDSFKDKLEALIDRGRITAIWLNHMKTGGYHANHVHANSHFSGTFYVNEPQNAAKILFHNPHWSTYQFCIPPLSEEEKNDKYNARYVHYAPKAGRILLWNSWLEHEVEVNNSIEPRLSISFNIQKI